MSGMQHWPVMSEMQVETTKQTLKQTEWEDAEEESYHAKLGSQMVGTFFVGSEGFGKWSLFLQDNISTKFHVNWAERTAAAYFKLIKKLKITYQTPTQTS